MAKCCIPVSYNNHIEADLKLLWLLGLGITLSGCSALMPTSDIPSLDTQGTYPLIGEVPKGEIDTLTEEERKKLEAELGSAREKNKKAAATPITQQVQ